MYILGKNLLNVTHEETDLGVTISEDLSWSKQVAKCAKKANRALGMIKHTFCYMDKDMFIPLYKALVRPHMEYCPQVWSPYLQRDIFQ